jgi:hypothetical protein
MAIAKGDRSAADVARVFRIRGAACTAPWPGTVPGWGVSDEADTDPGR